MADKDALVTRSDNKDQVEHARSTVKANRKARLADYRAVLATVEGRRLLWDLLGHCRVFESVYHPGPQIYALAAKQDVGHYVLININDADPESVFVMMREAQRARKRQRDENAAVHQQSQEGDED